MMNRPKPDPLDLMRTITRDDHKRPLAATTAIIMPVYNEDVTRVFEGVRADLQLPARDRPARDFDFFILSDSDDPNKWIEEEAAWLELCRQLNAFGHIFYRKRRKPINRKSGNVCDFCRRWGKRYRYMIVLDADSLMAGALIVNMVRIMEKNPGIGILQTFPKQIGADTLLGRVMQFAQSALRARVHRGAELLAVRRGQLLGPQRHRPPRALHRILRAARAARQGAVRRPHPEP